MTPLSDSEARTVRRFENAEPAPESWGGGLREALTAALQPVAQIGMRPDAVADALLLVVTAWAEQRARERAAEELRAAADVGSDRYGIGFSVVPTSSLRARADALTADARTGQR